MLHWLVCFTTLLDYLCCYVVCVDIMSVVCDKFRSYNMTGSVRALLSGVKFVYCLEYAVVCVCPLRHIGQTGRTLNIKNTFQRSKNNRGNSGYSNHSGHTYGTITDIMDIIKTGKKSKHLNTLHHFYRISKDNLHMT
jgi:hypothetical protein